MTRQSLVIGESISGKSQVAQPQVVPCGSRKNGRSNDLTPDNVLLSVSPLATGRKSHSRRLCLAGRVKMNDPMTLPMSLSQPTSCYR